MAHNAGSRTILPPAPSSVKAARPVRLEREHVLSPFSRNHLRERFGAEATTRPAMSLKEPSK